MLSMTKKKTTSRGPRPWKVAELKADLAEAKKLLADVEAQLRRAATMELEVVVCEGQTSKRLETASDVETTKQLIAAGLL